MSIHSLYFNLNDFLPFLHLTFLVPLLIFLTLPCGRFCCINQHNVCCSFFLFF